MLHFQGGDLLSIPVVYTDAIRDSMLPHVPINSTLHVCDCLRDRDFKLLIEDKGLRQALRDRCICCDKILTIGGPSVEHNLDCQLRAEHPEPSQAIHMLLDFASRISLDPVAITADQHELLSYLPKTKLQLKNTTKLLKIQSICLKTTI